MKRRDFITKIILGLLSIPFISMNKLFIDNKQNESMIRARRAVKRARAVLNKIDIMAIDNSDIATINLLKGNDIILITK